MLKRFQPCSVESVSESTYFNTLIILCLKDVFMSSIYKNGNKCDLVLKDVGINLPSGIKYNNSKFKNTLNKWE